MFDGRQQETGIDSIAVLPFGNVSGDPDTEYLSDGITDSVMNSLSQLRDLRVTARSMVFRYKGKQIDPLSWGATSNTSRPHGQSQPARRYVDRCDGTDGRREWIAGLG